MISPETASRTARITAVYRARASERPSPVCRDEWAQHLAGEDAWKLAKQADAIAPDMELGVVLRTAWLDERVRAWDGDQVVVLGAGLDTRAARLARDGLRFFEVDHPATQARKRATLAQVTGYPVDAATLVPCDFEQDDFLERLCASGWRPDRSCLVVWEGVLPYLTEAAVRSTLRRLSSALDERSRLLVDHLGPADLPAGRVDEASRVVRSLGEPFLFLTRDLRSIALAEGFGGVEVSSMAELCQAALGDPARVTPLYRRWYLVDASMR